MTPPPILDYASPTRLRRWVTPCVFFLVSLGFIYFFCINGMCIVGICVGGSFGAFDLLICSLANISAAVFFPAAYKIRRRSLRWAWLALITTVVDLASLLSCLGWGYFARGITDPSDIILGIASLLPIVVFVALSLLLSALIRELKSAP